MSDEGQCAPGFHVWEPSYDSAWGTIIGVSKCLKCGTPCRATDFDRDQSIEVGEDAPPPTAMEPKE